MKKSMAMVQAEKESAGDEMEEAGEALEEKSFSAAALGAEAPRQAFQAPETTSEYEERDYFAVSSSQPSSTSGDRVYK